MQPLNIPATPGGITDAVIRSLPIVTLFKPADSNTYISDEAYILHDIRDLLVDIRNLLVLNLQAGIIDDQTA